MPRIPAKALISIGLISPFVHASAITLSTNDNQLQVSPASLKLNWNTLAINSGNLKVNGQLQQASEIKTIDNNATWLLTPSQIAVTAQLDKNALLLTFDAAKLPSIQRGKPVTLSWFDLAQDKTQTLLLPFSEGMRVPTNNPEWGQFLAKEYSGSNTTQDLKMPFWSAKQGDKYVSYQLLTPTNNQLSFFFESNRLDMQSSHSFTALNQSKPFKVRVTLGNNQLSGAREYRQWRTKHGESETLSQKAANNPEVSKLIGASQVYLFGTGMLSPLDVKDWWGLKDWYINESGLTISNEAIKELKPLKKGEDWLAKYDKRLLISALAHSLKAKFPTDTPSLSKNTIKEQYDSAQNQKQWLEAHAGKYLRPSNEWGQAISKQTIASLEQAGLKKLWLGFDNWMPAFYQPGAVDKAKQAGYLVATYDSYNTAIEGGKNDSWLTAQLPKAMRDNCYIELADGTKKTGFRGNGYYLNPNCHLDYVQKRVQDILHYGHFNSLFIDVDATGMAREDYRDNSNEQQVLDAYNNRLSGIAKHEKVVLGSEDGNSLTTSGISFAHGLETVGFGWTDKDMKSNPKSPYFLGRWYPDEKPDFFFKPAKVKEPYKSLLFSPQYRVPLYQAVFHDEVINSHHWHCDSLKFSNVQMQRDLISMLYNTPAMVHLTADEANSANSKRVQALVRYQHGYLPIHKQLWDKQLTAFKWLDSKGQVQQTQFSDGSTITANFSNEIFKLDNQSLPAHSILALLANGEVVRWASK